VADPSTTWMLADALLLATADRPLTEGEQELVEIAKGVAQRVMNREIKA
jgi:hypothetical protein